MSSHHSPLNCRSIFHAHIHLTSLNKSDTFYENSEFGIKNEEGTLTDLFAPPIKSNIRSIFVYSSGSSVQAQAIAKHHAG